MLLRSELNFFTDTTHWCTKKISLSFRADIHCFTFFFSFSSLRRSQMCFFHASFNCWLTANYSHSGISAYVFLACCISGWDCTFLQAGICLTYMFEKKGDWVRLIFFQLTRGSKAEIKIENNHEDKRENKEWGMKVRMEKWKWKGCWRVGIESELIYLMKMQH